MLFIKKKQKKLNREMFAEALSIHFQDDVLKEEKLRNINKSLYLNDVLRVDVSWVSYHYSTYCKYISMDVSTYVENIRMASYTFHLDLIRDNNMYKPWNCYKKEIFHYMPDQFIELMNAWSKDTVECMEKKLKKEMQEKQLQKNILYDREEEVLNKYR